MTSFGAGCGVLKTHPPVFLPVRPSVGAGGEPGSLPEAVPEVTHLAETHRFTNGPDRKIRFREKVRSSLHPVLHQILVRCSLKAHSENPAALGFTDTRAPREILKRNRFRKVNRNVLKDLLHSPVRRAHFFLRRQPQIPDEYEPELRKHGEHFIGIRLVFGLIFE